MVADTRRSTRLRRFWQNYNLSSASQEEHQQVAEVFGQSGYVFEWLSATMENWQSEFLQLLTFVVLTASFIHKGSHESKDSDEELKAMSRRIEERLARLK